MLNEEPDVVYMSKMHVILYLSDERIVHITSDEGKYNKITYDCFFEKNVVAEDGETANISRKFRFISNRKYCKKSGEITLI